MGLGLLYDGEYPFTIFPFNTPWKFYFSIQYLPTPEDPSNRAMYMKYAYGRSTIKDAIKSWEIQVGEHGSIIEKEMYVIAHSHKHAVKIHNKIMNYLRKGSNHEHNKYGKLVYSLRSLDIDTNNIDISYDVLRKLIISITNVDASKRITIK